MCGLVMRVVISFVMFVPTRTMALLVKLSVLRLNRQFDGVLQVSGLFYY